MIIAPFPYRMPECFNYFFLYSCNYLPTLPESTSQFSYLLLHLKKLYAKLILVFVFAFIAMACNNNEKAKTAESPESVAKPPVAFPYLASYSSSFEMGDPAYVATILKG